MTTISAPPATPVPLLDLKKQYASIKDEILRVTSEVYESQGFILGPRVEAFEKAVAAYVGTKHAIGMSSGTDAQLAVMMALGIGPGDEVVTSPYTFFASAGAVARVGARPVFVDIEPASFDLDPARLERALTARTKLIQPVHLYGQCADMDPIRDVAKRKGIHVLEDACQSLGAAYRGAKAGALGDSCAFSFFPSKNLGGFGDGGMITTPDEAGGLAFEKGGLGFPREAAARHHVFNQFVVRVGRGRRDALKEVLEAKKIGCAIYYPVPLHLQECFASLGHRAGDFPESERAAKETLALPVFPELTAEQKTFLAFTLAEFSRS